MNRRGYIISAAVLLIDLLCFYFGGAIVALVALIYAAGIGEYIARVKCRAIQCDPALGVKHEKLFNCYQRVKGKIEEEGHRVPSNIKVCLIPGEEMNAYCFGSRSIGVTEGALNLDNKTVEAIIAHEMDHLFNGDSILNMILVANCLGIIAILAFYQFALIAVVYIIMILCCVMGLFRFSFASYFVTSKISGVIRFVMEAAKTVVLQASRLVISALGRKSEFMADRFAARMGYTFYLKRFLERFAPDRESSEQSFFAVLYDTHPSTALRIQELNSIDEQRMLPGG